MAVNIDTVRNEIYRCILDDPVVQDATHVSVTVQKHGFWIFGTKELHLMGRVESEKDKKKIDEIVLAHCHGMPVVDELRVGSSR